MTAELTIVKETKLPKHVSGLRVYADYHTLERKNITLNDEEKYYVEVVKHRDSMDKYTIATSFERIFSKGYKKNKVYFSGTLYQDYDDKKNCLVRTYARVYKKGTEPEFDYKINNELELISKLQELNK